MATGHAFVVFNYEKDRNRLARLFTSTPRSLYMFLRPSKRRTSSATLKCAEPVVESWMPSCSEMVSPFFWCRCLLAKGGLVEADVKTSVVVTSAPEPNEVLWENLQIDDEAEARVETISSGIVFVLIVVGILMLVLIKILQIMFVDFLSQRDGWNWMVKLFLKNIATIAVATVTLTWNFLSREIILKMTKRAGHDTATAEESAVFAKLSWAYVFNSVVIPLFIFGMLTASSPNSGGALIDQTWFEENSIITTAAMLIVCNYITDLMKVANPFPILMRYGFGRYAMSQTKQNELWKPMPFHTGVQYSLIFKSVSLGLVYGPIWPPAYLLTSIGLALSWICTRFRAAALVQMPRKRAGWHDAPDAVAARQCLGPCRRRAMHRSSGRVLSGLAHKPHADAGARLGAVGAIRLRIAASRCVQELFASRRGGRRAG